MKSHFRRHRTRRSRAFRPRRRVHIKRRSHRHKMPRVVRQRIRGVNFIADKCTAVFRQQFDFNVKQAAAGFATQTYFPGNSLETVTSPTLASYALNYFYFRVKKSRCSATFTNIEATYSKTAGITQLPVNDAAGVTPSASVYLSEQPRTKSAYLTPLSGSRSMITLSRVGSTATGYGDRTNTTDGGDVGVTSNYATPPTVPWNWMVWTQDVTSAGTLETAGTNIRVILTYEVEFLQRKQPTT